MSADGDDEPHWLVQGSKPRFIGPPLHLSISRPRAESSAHALSVDMQSNLEDDGRIMSGNTLAPDMRLSNHATMKSLVLL